MSTDVSAGTVHTRSAPESGTYRVLSMIAEWVRRAPHRTAIVGGPGPDVSYPDLAAGWVAVARLLRVRSLRGGEPVALTVPPSAAGVCAVLGVLRAGGVLLPLDPSLPPLRQRQLMADAGVRLVVGSATAAGIVEVTDTGAAPRVLPHAGAAYVIYTSGSTGRPKGVVCRGAGLSTVASAQRAVFRLEPGDRVAQIAPWSVDAALFELLLGLTAGPPWGSPGRRAAIPDRHWRSSCAAPTRRCWSPRRRACGRCGRRSCRSCGW